MLGPVERGGIGDGGQLSGIGETSSQFRQELRGAPGQPAADDTVSPAINISTTREQGGLAGADTPWVTSLVDLTPHAAAVDPASPAGDSAEHPVGPGSAAEIPSQALHKDAPEGGRMSPVVTAESGESVDPLAQFLEEAEAPADRGARFDYAIPHDLHEEPEGWQEFFREHSEALGGFEGNIENASQLMAALCQGRSYVEKTAPKEMGFQAPPVWITTSDVPIKPSTFLFTSEDTQAICIKKSSIEALSQYDPDIIGDFIDDDSHEIRFVGAPFDSVRLAGVEETDHALFTTMHPEVSADTAHNFHLPTAEYHAQEIEWHALETQIQYAQQVQMPDETIEFLQEVKRGAEAVRATQLQPAEGTAPVDHPLTKTAETHTASETPKGETIADRHPDWNIKIVTYYSAHTNARDMADMQKHKGDLYLYEDYGGNRWVENLQMVSDLDPTVHSPDFIDRVMAASPELKGTTLETMMRSLYGTGTIVGHNDLRPGDPITGEELEQSLQAAYIDPDFNTTLQDLEDNRLGKIARLENQRQEINVARTEDELERIFAEHPELAEIKDRPIVVLQTRGSAHAGAFESKFEAQGIPTEAFFPEESGETLSPSMQVINDLMQGKKPSKEALAKAHLDIMLTAAIRRNVKNSGNVNIEHVYLHRVISHFDLRDIEDFHNICFQTDAPPATIIDGLLASKGLGRLPTTNDELKMYCNQIEKKKRLVML